MEDVIFSESWKAYFEKSGLKTFNDFFKYDKGTVVDKNSRRDVTKFEITDGGDKKTFFMKRFYRPHIKDMIFSFLSLGKSHSQGQLEFNNASLLLKNNIETYRPVCFGHRVNFGIESESFFVTEEINGVCFTDWLAENYANMDDEQNEAVMASMADFVRRIHRAGVSMPDLYVWHLYMLNPIDVNNLKWAVIDLHRMSCGVKNSDKKIRNLGSLDYSMLDKYFSRGMKKAFIKAYVKNDSLFSDVRITKKIKERSAHICKRRKKKEY
ncbi:MAG TPA: lipopolysaccharide kinase InaA family protein [Sedimentisphaerales bacterium]|nr:lipopolysaccharide kinase InaA family protein [Sedimentisphaerales bacterium]